MIRRLFFAVILLLCVGGGLAGIKYLQISKMIAQSQATVMPPATVSTAEVRAATWESMLPAVGSVTAVQGITVRAELAGKIVRIGFESGDTVRAGMVLVAQDISEEQARVRALEASEHLAQITVQRLKLLVAQHSAAVADYDQALAEHKQIVAEIEALNALIAKKSIRAPFDGTLGLRQVSLGQNLESADPIVTLQQLDAMYVDFSLPQQQAVLVQPGYTVRIEADVLGKASATGQVTALDAQADSNTRTVRVRALVPNVQGALRPGMFVRVAVLMPQHEDVVFIPATAVLYAPYSDSAFVVESAPDAANPARLVLRQQLITLGERRGDFVVVKKGLTPAQTVVSTGVFKYRHGQDVVVDNTLAPQFSLEPQPPNS